MPIHSGGGGGGGQPPGSLIKDNFIEPQAVTGISKDTVTTVLTFTNAGADLFIDAVGGTGSARAEWTIFINDVAKIFRRQGVAVMNLNVKMFGFKLANGDKIDIKVEHFEGGTQEFKAEVRYFR